MTITLSTSEAVRNVLTADMEQHIYNLYSDMSAEVRAAIADLEANGRTFSDAARADYLRGLQEQLDALADEAASQLEGAIPAGAEGVAGSVVHDNTAWMEQHGMRLAGAYSHVPAEAIQAVISGMLYPTDADGNRWSFSAAIWGDNRQTHDDINRIIAEGIAQNKSALAIARDLETYVDPKAHKPWDWGKVYPGVKTQIDYNAQRLARTMMNHAYQYAMVATTKNNPFVTGYLWHSTHTERTCEICEDRDGKFFTADDLPLDHPNGMCYWEVYIPYSNEEIADRLADWVHGKNDPMMDIYMADIYNRHHSTVAAAFASNG